MLSGRVRPYTNCESEQAFFLVRTERLSTTLVTENREQHENSATRYATASAASHTAPDPL